MPPATSQCPFSYCNYSVHIRGLAGIEAQLIINFSDWCILECIYKTILTFLVYKCRCRECTSQIVVMQHIRNCVLAGIHRCLFVGSVTVALQFPEGLLLFACTIVDILERFLFA